VSCASLCFFVMLPSFLHLLAFFTCFFSRNMSLFVCVL
jgi:hypothetical protein